MGDEDVYVAPSPIHGEGVFARRPFKKGERILAIDDSCVVTEEDPLLPEAGGTPERYDDLAGGKVVRLRPPHFTNHSCSPSSYAKTIDGVRYRIALRDIPPGEEITSDYCINGRGDTVWQCNCGSRRCRRTIHSDYFHLPLTLQLEYLPLLDDWFVEENQMLVDRLSQNANA